MNRYENRTQRGNGQWSFWADVVRKMFGWFRAVGNEFRTQRGRLLVKLVPMLWLGLIQPETGLLGPGLATIGFDWKFTGWHTWALILVVDTWHWLGLVVRQRHRTYIP